MSYHSDAMATTLPLSPPASQASRGQPGPAAAAAARASRALFGLGGLGLVTSLFVVSRLATSWRLSGARTHDMQLAGQRIAYPAANADAIVVLVLALLGFAVIVVALVSAAREVIASARLARRVEARSAPLGHDVRLLDDARPLAFCAGLCRPRIYVSRGAVDLLDQEALDAVIAHERHHARQRDPLRLATSRVLARSLFFLPGLRTVADRHRAWAEIGADESVLVSAPHGRSALARAILDFVDHGGPEAGVDPSRIDHLAGDAPSWRLPAALSAVALAVLVLLVAVSALLGRLASGSASLALPLLSAQPCVLVLATIPVVLGTALTVAWRRRPQRRRAGRLVAATRRA
jgi:Zn-dependent protease with chaperone function